MSRQHATPLLLGATPGDAVRLIPIAMGEGAGAGAGYIDEAFLRDLIHAYPALLPIAEIDRQFENPVPICTELATDAGAIDVFLVTPSGLPVLVECKLWRNPQARREVIGQILDYAKELRHWTASTVQSKAAQRLKRQGNVVLDLVRKRHPAVDESDFSDALSQNLRRGRFLLLIVGDGIREGTASIAEYVQDHAGLHFTLGLVEMPIFQGPDGARLVVPRVLAKTETILRTVIEVPEGFALEEGAEAETEDGAPESPARREGRMRRNAVRQSFWRDFLASLNLDDPEQAFPPPARGGHIVFKFGAPGGSSWITVYRDMRGNSVGLFLSSNRNSPGERASQMLASYQAGLRRDLGDHAILDFAADRPTVSDELSVGNLEDPADRAAAITWLQGRTNDFVNALRPRIRAALRELAED